MAIESRCSSIGRSLDEPVRATASVVRSWLLVEQPGPWGSDAPVQSRLPKQVGAELSARAQRHSGRVLLLRNPDRPPPEPVRRCYVASSHRRGQWIEQRVVKDAGELLSIDFEALAGTHPPGFGAARQEPLYLVCTNGRHDPCCAHLGRPVARALFEHRPDGDRVWECSHFGGDRFAGNLVCLPHGLYFGRLGPDEAVRVIESYERGIIELDHYRGRAGDAFPVQAAEFFVRQAENMLGIDDLQPTARKTVEHGVAEVTLAGTDGRTFTVRVGVVTAPEPRPLTCAAPQDSHPASWRLLDLEIS